MSVFRTISANLGLLAAFGSAQFGVSCAILHLQAPTWLRFGALLVPLVTLILPSTCILPRTLQGGTKWLSGAVIILASSLLWWIAAGPMQASALVRSIEMWAVFGVPLHALPAFLGFLYVFRNGRAAAVLRA